MKNENHNQPEAYPLEDLLIQPERQAGDAHPEGPRCRRCGEAVPGRRRNGYCSDRCRMGERRQEQAVRVNELLTTIEESVTALRGELGGHSEAS